MASQKSGEEGKEMRTICALLVVFCLLAAVAPGLAQEITTAVPGTTVVGTAAPELDFTSSAWKPASVSGFDPRGMWRKDALILGFGSAQLKASAIVFARLDYFGVPNGSAGVLAIVWEWTPTRYDSMHVVEAVTHSYYVRSEDGWVRVQRSEVRLNRTRGAQTPIFTLDSPFGRIFHAWVNSLGASDQRAAYVIPYWEWQPTWNPRRYFDWWLPAAAPLDDPRWQL